MSPSNSQAPHKSWHDIFTQRRPARRVLLAAALVLLTSAFLAAGPAAAEEIVLTLDDPSRPAELHAALLNGSVLVTGYEGQEVLLSTDGDDDEEVEKVNGMYRIPNRSLRITAEVEGNRVEIKSGIGGDDADLRIKVPVRTSLRISLVNGDELVVENVEGEHELTCINGDIDARDLRGSVVASSTNGDINVRFAAVTSGKEMSFITTNGDIDTTFPQGTKAELRLASMRGEIYTDFEAKLLPSESEVEHDESRRRYSIGREVRTMIGGGGPSFHYRTLNGDIYIRRAK